MARAKDLDTIAPDDPIIIPQPEKEKPFPDKKSFKKNINKNKKIKDNKANSHKKAYDVLGHTKHSFSSFLINPSKFNFLEREKNEPILLAVRAHWFTNFKWIATSLILIFVPIVVAKLGIFSQLPLKYQLVSSLFWYLIVFIYAFEKFLDWYFDVFVITDRRVVDIKFNNLLNKHFAEAELGVIQDISSSVQGIFGTFFNYGTILVQTASDINQIVFINVPSCGKIIKLLQELRGEYHKRYPGGRL